MHRNTWKAFERRVAAHFGTERTPLSGGNSRHTRSDSLHPSLYIECKSNVSHPILRDWNDFAAAAKRWHDCPPVAIIKREPHMSPIFMWHIARPPFWVMDGNYRVTHYVKRDSIASLMDATYPRADAEDKAPVLALGVLRRKGFWLAAYERDIPEILAAQAEINEQEQGDAA